VAHPRDPRLSTIGTALAVAFDGAVSTRLYVRMQAARGKLPTVPQPRILSRVAMTWLTSGFRAMQLMLAA
jgi:hypothetical protein